MCNCSFLVVDGSAVGRGFHSVISCSPVSEDAARLVFGCLSMTLGPLDHGHNMI